jgi:hypothetical protein
VPEFNTHQIESKIWKKKNKFLLEELKFGSAYNPELNTLEANQGTDWIFEETGSGREV